MALRCPQVHIEGLKGTEYLDSLDGRKRKAEDGDVLQFNGEVDRIYTGVPGNLQASIPLAAADECPVCTCPTPYAQHCKQRSAMQGS